MEAFVQATGYYPRGIKDMLSKLNLKHKGRLHSGIGANFCSYPTQRPWSPVTFVSVPLAELKFPQLLKARDTVGSGLELLDRDTSVHILTAEWIKAFYQTDF
uniref:Uncharacterized protein n=1 Tax=Timema douglasi TaxID=61478 RepID=A0A7R8VK99_TIMDO|nr:unnamed protein product [Timema douglasi]